MATFPGTTGNDQAFGAFEEMFGLAGNDNLGSDDVLSALIDGGEGWDYLFFEKTDLNIHGEIRGGTGNDFIGGARGSDELFGGGGDDYIIGGFHLLDPGGPPPPTAPDKITGGGGSDLILGAWGKDRIRGGGGDDSGSIVVPDGTFWFAGGTHTVEAGLFGGDGNDRILGGGGDDLIGGGLGRDKLRGDNGADVLTYFSTEQSPKGAGNRDIILGFSRSDGDLIDLSDIDANQNMPENQPFKYISDKPFHGKAGELRFEDGLLQGDTDGNGRPELEISLPGTGNLRANDLDL